MTSTLAIEPLKPPLEWREGGRVIRVGGTRVSLDTLVYAFKTGSTPEEIVDRYPVLDLVSVYGAVNWYLSNREAVEGYLSEREREGNRIRQEIEARWPRKGSRERILAKRRRMEGER